MKKIISLALAIIMVATLFSALSITSVSAETPASNQTVFNISNTDAFGGYFHCDNVGYTSNDSVCINGSNGSFGFSQKFDNLENGLYIYSAYVKNLGFNGEIKLNMNPGADGSTEKHFVIGSDIASDVWTPVYLMANVTNGYCFIGGWCSGGAGHSLLMDCIKFEKLDGALDIANCGAAVSANSGFLGDASFNCLNVGWTKGVFTGLDTFTTYTFYYAVNGITNGDVKIRTFNGTDSDENKRAAVVPITADNQGGWRIYSAQVTTGLVGMISIQIWRGDPSSAYNLGTIAFKKDGDNKYGFVPNSIIANDSGSSLVSIVEDGYVTDTAIKVPKGTTTNFGKWLNHVDNGLYLLTAYAKSEGTGFTFKGHDGPWTGTEYGCVYAPSGNEWQQIKIEVSVTGGQLTTGFWFDGITNDVYLDGFKIQKMNYINIINPNNWWPRNPTRFSTYCSKGYFINASGGYSEEITQYYDGDNLVNFQPNTTYIMTLSYASWYIGGEAENIPGILADAFIQSYNTGNSDYCSRVSAVFETTGSEWQYKTITMKFTTGSDPKIVLGFWHGDPQYKINMEGHAICKANSNEYYKEVKEADIGESGSYLTDNTQNGFIEARETRALVLGDATGDYKVDILDFIRLKKYLAGTTTDISLKSCRFDEEKGAEIKIEGTDLAALANIILNA